MSPKEKANELVERFVNISPFEYRPKLTEVNITAVADVEYAKQCALIAVDEILGKRLAPHLGWREVEYWNEVKNEIEKL